MPQVVELQLPALWPHQQRFAEDTSPVVVVVSGTKAGKTASAATVAVLDAVNNAEWMVWWVAPVYRQAQIGFRILKKLCRQIPGIKVTNSALKMELPNGSTIECRSADIPDNLYGEGVSSMIVEEAGRMSNEALYALESTVSATGGQQRYISNPGPTEGYFFQLCQLGKDPNEPAYSYHHWLSSDSPLVKKDLLERRKRALPPQMYRMLYEGEFLEGEDAVFRNVDRAMVLSNDEVLRAGATLPNWMHQRGRWLGVDLGRHHDSTVITGLVDEDEHGEKYRLGYFDRFTKIGWNQIYDRIEASYRTFQAPIMLETNGPGDAVWEELVHNRNLPVEPFNTSNKTKQVAVLGWAAEIDEQKCRLAPVEPMPGELKVFRYKVTPSGNFQYGAPEGMGDDCVMSGAIAAFFRRTQGGAGAATGVVEKASTHKEALRQERVMEMIL